VKTADAPLRSRPPVTDLPAGPTRLLAGWYRSGGRADLHAHLAVHGPLDLPPRPDPRFGQWLADAVHRAGLTGRGGAGFPTARKLAAAAGWRRPLLVVNAMEGEPASAKDRALLSCAPHLVLDGAEATALAIGATELLVCVAAEHRDVAARLRTALAERVGRGLVRVAIDVAQPPGTFVAGEESALVRWVGGGPALPTFRPAKGAPLRVGRRPALVQNAETMAHVGLIARYGPEWFRAEGLPEAPGTTLITLTGALTRPGVHEIALGTPLRAIVALGAPAEVGAVLLGGYGGTWLAAEHLDVAYSPPSLGTLGATVGAGVVGVLPAAACGIAETARLATFLAEESAGQCGPCVHGLPAVAEDLDRLARGVGDRATFDRLRRRLQAVTGRGACGHPDGAARMVKSALSTFATDLAAHLQQRPCAGRGHPPVMPLPRPGWSRP